MNYKANESFIIETHLKISKVIDGDSLMVNSKFNINEKEIRLYGLDAPETKYNRKLKEDAFSRFFSNSIGFAIITVYFGSCTTGNGCNDNHREK